METVLYRLYSCATFYKLHGKEIENHQVCYGGRTAIPTGTAGGDSGGPILHAASSGEDMYVIGALIEAPHNIFLLCFPTFSLEPITFLNGSPILFGPIRRSINEYIAFLSFKFLIVLRQNWGL